jgi:hypothetical protein
MTIKEQAALIPRPHLEAVQVAESQFVFQTAHVPTPPAKPAVEPVRAPEEAIQLPTTYRPESVKAKIHNWLEDNYWRGVDRELGLTDTDESIVLKRQEQRLANRILVANHVAGVDKPPVWSKNKRALAVAAKAIQAD